MHSRGAGFTIVEMLVTVVILSLVIAGLTKLFMSSNLLHNKNEEVLRVQQDVRNVSKLLERRLQEVGSDSLSIKGFKEKVNSMGGEAYYLDYNSDEELERQTIDGSPDSGGRVDTIEMTYKDKDRNIVSSLDDARLVEYEVCGSVPDDAPHMTDGYSHCVESAVATRNLFY